MHWCTKTKTGKKVKVDWLYQDLLLVEAGAEELRPLVEGGQVVLRVHDVVFLSKGRPMER